MDFVVSVPTVDGQNQYSYYCTVKENSYDINTNTSNVTIAFSIKGISAWYENWTTHYGIIVDNDVKKDESRKMTVDGKQYYRLTSWTGDIVHNNNGSKKINVSVFLYHNDTANYLPRQYTSTSPLQMGSVQLTTIPRTSEISYAGATTIGGNCDIRWTPASADFKYKIKFSLGSWTATTGEFIEPSTTGEYKYTGYTIPSDSTLLNNISKDSGTMKAVLETYSADGVLVGSSSEKSFTVKISGGLNPTIGQITLTPQTYDCLLQGKNKLQISVSDCSASAGSSIKSYTFSGDGISATTKTGSSVIVGPISKTGDLTFNVKVTDTREQSATATATIKCYAYKNPTFQSFRISDKIEDASGNITINCSYTVTYYSVNKTNSISYFLISGAGTNVEYSTWTISEPDSNEIITASGNAVITLGSDASASYNIYATVKDNYGGSRNSKTESLYGDDRIFNIYPDGTGIAIGKMATQPNMFDCRWKAKFDDKITFGSGTQGSLYISNGANGNIVYILTGGTTNTDSNAGIGIASNSVFAAGTNDDGEINLGYSTKRWNQLWAANSTIQTSDRNKKKDITDMSDVQEQLFNQLKPVTYKMISGTSDRTHYGFIAQDVEDALIDVGLSGKDFAGFCKDERKDDNGKIVLDTNGDVANDYALRYSEFIALNTYMIQKLQERIFELENTIKELKEHT